MSRYIDADNLKEKAFLIDIDNACNTDNGFFPFKAVDVDDIDAEPTANVQPIIHAHWCFDFETPYCSSCGFNPENFFHTEGYDTVCMNLHKPPTYCPNCGAIMDEIKK